MTSTIHERSLAWELHERARENSTSWLDTYRPRTLDAMALHPTLRRLLEAYFGQPRLLTHLILHGPSGSGKTTLADVIACHFFPVNHAEHVKRLDASDRRGIDHVRTLIEWLKIRAIYEVLGPWWGIVALSEADGLTPEAQAALKDPMQEFSYKCRFIFTTNHPHKLIPALHSRCDVLEMLEPPVDERGRVLQCILSAEGVDVPASLTREFAQLYPDMRQLILQAQKVVMQHGTLIVQPHAVVAADHEAESDEVDGAALLSELIDTFERYLSLPDGAAEALALWTMHAHAHDAAEVSPILAAVSPVKRSGKTRLLELLSALVPCPLFTSNITPASIFRKGMDQPTLLADEADTYMKLRPEIQGILNSGHRRSAALVTRVVGDQSIDFPTWYPKAIALIDRTGGQLPATVEDRSIVVPMRRRRPEEKVSTLRLDRVEDELGRLRDAAARWAGDNLANLRAADPAVPGRLNDRASDNWRAMLAIADRAGGEWPERARGACLVLSGLRDEFGEQTIQLLADMRTVFDEEGRDIPTRVFLDRLCRMDERPWPGWLTSYRIALLLRSLGIRSKALWTNHGGGRKRMQRGYSHSDMEDAFARYLS